MRNLIMNSYREMWRYNIKESNKAARVGVYDVAGLTNGDTDDYYNAADGKIDKDGNPIYFLKADGLWPREQAVIGMKIRDHFFGIQAIQLAICQQK